MDITTILMNENSSDLRRRQRCTKALFQGRTPVRADDGLTNALLLPVKLRVFLWNHVLFWLLRFRWRWPASRWSV